MELDLKCNRECVKEDDGDKGQQFSTCGVSGKIFKEKKE